jgi:hypothetical protein
MGKRMRKTGIVILPFILCFLASCGPKIYLKTSNLFEIEENIYKRGQKIKIALVEFFPLPNNYPEGMHRFEYTFSGEVYEDEKSEFRVFVPNNYKEMINLAFAVAFERSGVELVFCQTVTEAILSKPDFIVTGLVKEYKVTTEKKLKEKRSLPLWQFMTMKGPELQHFFEKERVIWLTHVVFLIDVLDGKTAKVLLHSEIKDNFEHDATGISRNLHTDNLIFHDITETTYHPLRTLMVYSTHNCANKLLKTIGEVCLAE